MERLPLLCRGRIYALYRSASSRCTLRVPLGLAKLLPFLEIFCVSFRALERFPFAPLEKPAVAMLPKETLQRALSRPHTFAAPKSAAYARGACLYAIAALFLSGCAGVSQERTSGLDSLGNAPASVRAAYEARIFKVRDDLRAACFSQELQSYYRMTPCLASGITRAMMRDNSRITREQRTAAQKVFALTKELNDETLRIMEETGAPELMARATQARAALPAAEALQADLLEGRITWGEYNTRRRALHTQAAGQSDVQEETNASDLSATQHVELDSANDATNDADESED